MDPVGQPEALLFQVLDVELAVVVGVEVGEERPEVVEVHSVAGVVRPALLNVLQCDFGGVQLVVLVLGEGECKRVRSAAIEFALLPH